jgi:hypothetical protein
VHRPSFDISLHMGGDMEFEKFVRIARKNIASMVSVCGGNGRIAWILSGI